MMAFGFAEVPNLVGNVLRLAEFTGGHHGLRQRTDGRVVPHDLSTKSGVNIPG